MPLNQVAPPYPIFADIDGTPLDSGYIYLGLVNLNPETNPIQAYWDSALSIPAAQPIRTINGYPSRNGSPAVLYTNGAFSITIKNKQEKIVVTSPVGYSFEPGSVASSADIIAILANIAMINTVGGNVGSIVPVAENIASVAVVAANVADINTVAADLNEPVSEINTVAGSISNVDAVGQNIDNVNAVAGNSANINSVAGNAANINSVAANTVKINTVADNIADIESVADNIDNVNAVAANEANINAASGNAQAAQNYAQYLETYIDEVVMNVQFPLDLGFVSTPALYNHFDLGGLQ